MNEKEKRVAAVVSSAVGTVLFASVFLTACMPAEKKATASSSSLKPPAERKVAPDFALKDADGRTVRLSDYRGKVVLLNFWATWCGPCRIEIPWFNEFQQQHRERGLVVLGISMDEEGWDVVKPYVTALKVNYRILLGDEMVADLYGGVSSLPTSFLIDRRGRIASVHVGLVSKSVYEREIEELLAQGESSGGRASGADVVRAGLGANGGGAQGARSVRGAR
ncbi:MAG: TlpA disulfide reductase family protein [Bryobacterales bacterium]|nr:TlpA family protein disulfide reductase [Bryobacteraceae bacterium]MDW8353424.1 TlpA disulfide reductase family protein [Bryobacterales bacterium]